MMKDVKKILAIGVLFAMFIIITTVHADKYDNTMKNKVYSIDTSTFESFLEKPSEDVLAAGAGVAISSYYKSENNDDYIRKTITSDGEEEFNKVVEGMYERIGNLPVYDDLLNFICEKDKFQTYLGSNGVIGNIDNIVIVDVNAPEVCNVPVFMWIKADQSDYFITIELTYVSNETEYRYTLYTISEFSDKYGYKDGVLKINDRVIDKDIYIKFQNSGVYMPFRTVMEALGAKIEWNPDTNSVNMVCNGKEYVLSIQNGLSLHEKGQPFDLLLPPPGSYGAYSYQIIDDRIIMDNRTMSVLVSLMKARIDVDYEGLTVDIYSE